MAGANGEVTETHIEHYGRRARGGVGLIIIGNTYVSEDGKGSRGQMGAYDDHLIPGLKRLVDAIHAEGAKVALELTHAGARTHRDITGKQPSGPWNIMVPRGIEIPRAFTVPEIKTKVVRFGDAAYRALQAGFDAVELHGAHGYLLCQFLSPYANQRNDEYGGNLAKRLLFPTEVIREVKSRMGQNVPLFYRFGADDLLEGGLTRQEGKLAAQHLAQAGVDVMDVSVGLGDPGPRNDILGYYVPLAEGIKGVVKVPVIGVGNISEPEYADRIIREVKVDMVAIGRTLVSNPDFPRQAAEKLGIKL